MQGGLCGERVLTRRGLHGNERQSVSRPQRGTGYRAEPGRGGSVPGLIRWVSKSVNRTTCQHSWTTCQPKKTTFCTFYSCFEKRRRFPKKKTQRLQPCRAVPSQTTWSQCGVMSPPLSQGNVFRPEWRHGANPEKVPCNSSMSMIRIAIYLDRSQWTASLQYASTLGVVLCPNSLTRLVIPSSESKSVLAGSWIVAE